NNIRGFKRTPAYWDAEALELRLADTSAREQNEAGLDASVLAWLAEHPGRHATSKLREAIPGRDSRVDAALERLLARAEVRDLGRDGGPWSGRAGAPRYWQAATDAALTSAPLFGPTRADPSAGSRNG